MTKELSKKEEYRPGQRKIDHEHEMRIVALLARGDKQKDIVDEMVKDGLEISIQSIAAVKKRNSSLLDHMRGAIAEREAANATRILDKTHNLLNRKLDASERDQKTLENALRDFQEGNIDEKELQHIKKGITHLSVSELTHLSKEMFTQKTKATEEPETSPQKNREQMETLMKAIQDGDKVTMQQIVFNDEE